FSQPPKNKDRYERSILEAKSSCRIMTTRASLPYASEKALSGIKNSICPAAFVNYKNPIEKKYKICNVMPFGAHDIHFNQYEAGFHAGSIESFTKKMDALGFSFISHNGDERKLLSELKSN